MKPYYKNDVLYFKVGDKVLWRGKKGKVVSISYRIKTIHGYDILLDGYSKDNIIYNSGPDELKLLK